MLALYRCGRQADALEDYRRARHTLVEEIGVEPGAELRALQHAILAQDPALEPLGDDEIAEIARGPAWRTRRSPRSSTRATRARPRGGGMGGRGQRRARRNGRAELRAAEDDLAGDVLVRRALEAAR